LLVFRSINCFPNQGIFGKGYFGFQNLILFSQNSFSKEDQTSFPVDASFGRPCPPNWNDETQQAAFALNTHKIVNYDWLVNLISKVESLKKQSSSSNKPKKKAQKLLKKKNIIPEFTEDDWNFDSTPEPPKPELRKPIASPAPKVMATIEESDIFLDESIELISSDPDSPFHK